MQCMLIMLNSPKILYFIFYEITLSWKTAQNLFLRVLSVSVWGNSALFHKQYWMNPILWVAATVQPSAMLLFLSNTYIYMCKCIITFTNLWNSIVLIDLSEDLHTDTPQPPPPSPPTHIFQLRYVPPTGSPWSTTDYSSGLSRRLRGGGVAKKHEIYAATLGGHLFTNRRRR